jgi:hypothetical protein
MLPRLAFKRRSADWLSPYRAVNTFHLGYKNQSVFYVSGTSRCLFSDKHKTRTSKYRVGRAYTCWNVQLGASRNQKALKG